MRVRVHPLAAKDFTVLFSFRSICLVFLDIYVYSLFPFILGCQVRAKFVIRISKSHYSSPTKRVTFSFKSISIKTIRVSFSSASKVGCCRLPISISRFRCDFMSFLDSIKRTKWRLAIYAHNMPKPKKKKYCV